MTTVRKLTAAFGFQVDTTPADRFNASINKTKQNLRGLSDIDFTRLKGGLTKAFRVGIAGAVAGIGAGIVTALKFGDIKQALSQLEFQFKGSLQPLKDEIEAILADPVIGKLTTRLDLLNAAATAAGQGIDRAFIIRNLSAITAFSTQFRQDIGEGTATFVEFLKSGNLDILLRTGRISAEQAQFLQAAGIDPGREGVRARQIRLESLLREITPEIRINIQKLIDEGALSQKRLLNTLDATATELGERTLPAFKAVTEGAIDLVDDFRKGTKKEGVVESFLKTFFILPEGRQLTLPEFGGTEDPKISKDPAIGRFFREFFEEFGRRFEDARKRGFRPKQSFRTFPIPAGLGTAGQAAGDTQTITNNNTVNVTIEPGATADANEIKRVVGEEMQKTFGRSVESSKNSTLIRGAGQVR